MTTDPQYQKNLEAFKRFYRANPHVYDLYVKFAREAKQAGLPKLSISLLTERIRWETSIVTKSEDGMRISNNHKPFYARMLSKRPEFEGMFVIKKQTSRTKKRRS